MGAYPYGGHGPRATLKELSSIKKMSNSFLYSISRYGINSLTFSTLEFLVESHFDLILILDNLFLEYLALDKKVRLS